MSRRYNDDLDRQDHRQDRMDDRGDDRRDRRQYRPEERLQEERRHDNRRQYLSEDRQDRQDRQERPEIRKEVKKPDPVPPASTSGYMSFIPSFNTTDLVFYVSILLFFILLALSIYSFMTISNSLPVESEDSE